LWHGIHIELRELKGFFGLRELTISNENGVLGLFLRKMIWLFDVLNFVEKNQIL